jgi:sugar (pentulose or hexulose) kinase
MEIKSAAAAKPIEIPQVQESTLLGAALLGGVGAGVYSDHYKAARVTYRPSRVFQPEPELVEKCREITATYQRILPLAREISSAISEG